MHRRAGSRVGDGPAAKLNLPVAPDGAAGIAGGDASSPHFHDTAGKMDPLLRRDRTCDFDGAFIRPRIADTEGSVYAESRAVLYLQRYTGEDI